jgi:protein TonB
MSPRLGFIISLLAACGIHAVILLVPRTPMAPGTPIIVVELDLSTAPAPGEGAPPGMRPKALQAKVAQQLPSVQPAPVEAGPPGISRSFAPIESPVVAAATAQPSTPLRASIDPADSPRMSGSDAGPASQSEGESEAPSAARSEGSVGEGSGAFTAGPTGFNPPRPLAEIVPVYPLSARRAGLEGLVKVAAFVDASGCVTQAEVVVSSGHASLDRAVLEAVQRSLFSPALQDGKPVPCRIVVPRRFVISTTERK